MAKLFDEQGNAVEALTQEELDAKKQEIIDAYKEEHPDTSGDLAVSANKVTELEKEIADMKTAAEEGDGGDGKDKDKGGQVERLKQEKINRDAEITKLTNTIKEQGESFSKFKEGMFSDIKTKAIEKLSGGDEEVAKKIGLEFDKYGDAPDTESGTLERLTSAATIVNGKAPEPNFMDNATKIIGTKGEGTQGDEGKGEETPNSVTMRKEFDISDKDVAEFGGEVTPNINVQ